MSRRSADARTSAFLRDIRARRMTTERIQLDGRSVECSIGEFWTPRQRQASRLHEISYRACFKAQLPRYFIERLSDPNDRVYDPFSGRGTTVVEAAFLGRRIVANDINPLSEILARPRLAVPPLEEIAARLASIRFDPDARAEMDLRMFFHKRTEAEVVSLRRYLQRRRSRGTEDDVDRWIRMVATNRLTGHSRGFFSVYTLPPNQAVQPERQRLINRRLGQKPEYRDVKAIILRKSRSLMIGLEDAERDRLHAAETHARFLTGDARRTRAIRSASIRLTVTSPPFLNIVDYAGDNWLRCWFNGLDADRISRHITASRSVDEWSAAMGEVFHELHRITAPQGWVAFEVGEVHKRNVRLEECVVPLGRAAGFTCVAIMINRQRFTKTSNIWGVRNNRHGTNTNRIVIFRKD